MPKRATGVSNSVGVAMASAAMMVSSVAMSSRAQATIYHEQYTVPSSDYSVGYRPYKGETVGINGTVSLPSFTLSSGDKIDIDLILQDNLHGTGGHREPIYDLTYDINSAPMHPGGNGKTVARVTAFSWPDGDDAEIIITAWTTPYYPSVTTPAGIYTFGTYGGGTPEPSAWAMMLIGLGGVGSVMRSRPRQAPVRQLSSTFAN
jgi:hypothetical protein